MEDPKLKELFEFLREQQLKLEQLKKELRNEKNTGNPGCDNCIYNICDN